MAPTIAAAVVVGVPAQRSLTAHFSPPNDEIFHPATIFAHMCYIFFIFDIDSVPQGRVSFSVQQSSMNRTNMRIRPDSLPAAPKCGNAVWLLTGSLAVDSQTIRGNVDCFFFDPKDSICKNELFE